MRKHDCGSRFLHYLHQGPRLRRSVQHGIGSPKAAPAAKRLLVAFCVAELPVASSTDYGLGIESALAESPGILEPCRGSASQLARNCKVAADLARIVRKSHCVTVANGSIVSTPDVRDAIEPAVSAVVEVRGYCSADDFPNLCTSQQVGKTASTFYSSPIAASPRQWRSLVGTTRTLSAIRWARPSTP